MCGIIGCVGDCCFDRIVNGLKQLQNRGYDSAGISTISNLSNPLNLSYSTCQICEIKTHKTASDDSSNAIEFLEGYSLNHKCDRVGIGHTRWATHGPKTDVNAHPHVDMCNCFSVVHNGIIENYQELKDKLVKVGFVFKSQTDTEVIVNLISYKYSQTKNIKKAILNAVKYLSGTFALAILCVDDPNSIYCIRRGSPLLIGIAESFAIIASEQSGFNGELSKYFVLDNDNLCVIRQVDDKTIEFDIQRNIFKEYQINLTKENLRLDSLGEYSHWTEKEIYEQIQSSKRALNDNGRLLNQDKVCLGGLSKHALKLSKIQHLILLGCGTSYHAGLIASYHFKELCAFETVQVFDGADFEERDLPKTGNVGCIFLSQSGETRDLYKCLQFIQKSTRDIQTIGVINVVDSMIARAVDCGVYLNAGREFAVASTKSFTSQLIVLTLISIWFSQNQNCCYSKRKKYINELRNLSYNIEKVIDTSFELLDNVADFFTFPSCFLLGKGKGEGIAREGALKIKEISYIHAEGYSSSALKHGPFALLQKEFPVVLIAFDNEYYDKCINAMEEILSRGARVIFITNRETNIDRPNVQTINLPHDSNYCADILSIIPLQILAYKLSLKKGINPDFPRNLAKVVTVE